MQIHKSKLPDTCHAGLILRAGSVIHFRLMQNGVHSLQLTLPLRGRSLRQNRICSSAKRAKHSFRLLDWHLGNLCVSSMLSFRHDNEKLTDREDLRPRTGSHDPDTKHRENRHAVRPVTHNPGAGNPSRPWKQKFASLHILVREQGVWP
jgi:hypothetical protein